MWPTRIITTSEMLWLYKLNCDLIPICLPLDTYNTRNKHYSKRQNPPASLLCVKDQRFETSNKKCRHCISIFKKNLKKQLLSCLIESWNVYRWKICAECWVVGNAALNCCAVPPSCGVLTYFFILLTHKVALECWECPLCVCIVVCFYLMSVVLMCWWETRSPTMSFK